MLFDRGIQKIDTYVQLDQQDKCFVTRLKVNRRYRLLTTQDVERGEELWFLTNRKDLSAQQIALAYKQHLQFKTFVSYDPGGMQIYLYCLLIAAILFVIYKITNKLTGYKIALLQFGIEIYKAIIKDIVLFCGGNPDLVDQRL